MRWIHDLLRRGAAGAAAGASLLAVLVCAVPAAGAAGNGMALWRVVHDMCVPDARLTGHPAPCAKVDVARGYAIVKDLQHPTQLLLVPTARITGVEDPRLQDPDEPNYWMLAWENRSLVERRARRPLPREQVGLVVNSAYARTQSQLHIHIDCLRADVAQALADHLQEIGPQWRPLKLDLAGRWYLARWIPESELATRDPFKLLADYPDRAEMARQTLVLAGASSADRGPGFVLLTDQWDTATGDGGHGEDLLDHGCRGGGVA